MAPQVWWGPGVDGFTGFSPRQRGSEVGWLASGTLGASAAAALPVGVGAAGRASAGVALGWQPAPQVKSASAAHHARAMAVIAFERLATCQARDRTFQAGRGPPHAPPQE